MALFQAQKQKTVSVCRKSMELQVQGKCASHLDRNKSRQDRQGRLLNSDFAPQVREAQPSTVRESLYHSVTWDLGRWQKILEND